MPVSECVGAYLKALKCPLLCRARAAVHSKQRRWRGEASKAHRGCTGAGLPTVHTPAGCWCPHGGAIKAAVPSLVGSEQDGGAGQPMVPKPLGHTGEQNETLTSDMTPLATHAWRTTLRTSPCLLAGHEQTTKPIAPH